MADVVDLATEKRIAAANEAAKANLWTPRDVLVQVLRDIDSGKLDPTGLAVVWLRVQGGAIKSGYTIACENTFMSHYLADKFKRDLWEDGEA